MEEKQYDFVPPTSSETPAQARSSHGLRGRRTNNARHSGHQRDSDSQGSSGSLQGVSIGNGKSKYDAELSFVIAFLAWSSKKRALFSREFYRRTARDLNGKILVYNIFFINISVSVSYRATDISVLSIN